MSTVTMTAVIIALAIIAVVSIAYNVKQHYEIKAEKQEAHEAGQEFVKANAKLEVELEEMKAKYENECNHRAWAIGRIKDQQAVIDQLKSNKVAYKPRKEGGHA